MNTSHEVPGINVAIYENEKDNRPRQGFVSWEALVSDMMQHETTPCSPCPGKSCTHKLGPAWSPVELVGDGTRKAGNVKSITAAVFDLDGITPEALLAVAKSAEDFQYVCHSTHSPNSYRFVFRLSRPVLASEWPRFWPRIVERFRLPADPACKDLARLYFFPSAPADAVLVAEQSYGAALDVDATLAAPFSPPIKSPHSDGSERAGAVPPPVPSPGGGTVFSGSFDMDLIRSAMKALRRPESKVLAARILAHEPLAEVGARDATVNAAASLIATLLEEPLPEEVALAVLEPSIARMQTDPEGLPFWMEKARYSFSRAVERRAIREARERGDRSALLSVLPRAIREPSGPGDITTDESADDWRQKLLVTRDAQGNPTGVKACEANLESIFSHDDRWAGGLRFNDVTKTIDVGGPLSGVPAADIDFAASVWLQRSEYRCPAKARDVGGALLRVARLRTYDPLKDYLRGLVWDETPRLTTYFHRILGAPHTRLNEVLGRKWTLSAVARALEPGCKVDNVLILQGKYGARKTSFVETMAGAFYSNGKVDFASKDSRMLAARYWLVELAEMSGYRRADKEAVKDWLSTRIDSYRPPYGRVIEDYPRRAIFVGTANDDDFLTEPNRREWPVQVGVIDIAQLAKERDQIFAEAVALYDAAAECPSCAVTPSGRCPAHSWWLDGENAQAMMGLAAEFGNPDPVLDMVTDWWLRMAPERRPTEFQVFEAAMDALQMTRDKVSIVTLREVGRALKHLGFRKARVMRMGVQAWMYRATPELMAIPQGAKAKAPLSLVENIT